jgi:transposase
MRNTRHWPARRGSKPVLVEHEYLSVLSGKRTCAWLERHPRFEMHIAPVHCSWMNQIEQWFSILQRNRLRAPNVADLDDLEAKILANVLATVDNPCTRRRSHWTDKIRAATNVRGAVRSRLCARLLAHG